MPPKDIRFSEVTSYSFKTNWSPAGDNVFSYHVTYKEDAGHGEEVTVVEPASSTSVLLSNLKPETLYLVNVTAEYEDGFSVPLAGQQTTEEGEFLPPPSQHQQFTVEQLPALLHRCSYRSAFVRLDIFEV